MRRRRGISMVMVSLRLICFAAGVLSLALALDCPAQGRVLHHDLKVSIETGSHRLVASDAITLKQEESLPLRFTLNSGARILSVAQDGEALRYAFHGGVLEVPLPAVQNRAEVKLTVDYEASFHDRVPVDPIHTEDPGYGVNGVISSQGIFLTAGAGWYPDLPGSLATYRLEADVPKGTEVVTAGRLRDRKENGDRSIFIWESDHPVRGVALSAGPYTVEKGRASEIPTLFYHFQGTESFAEPYLKAVARYLGLYQDLFGPYPFSKFAVVENFFPTGYGFPSYTLLGSQVIRLPFIVDSSLGHEVAHSWWGNSVFVDTRQGNWSEGLTTYVADHLYKERASPEEGRHYRSQILRSYATLVSPKDDFPLTEFTGRTSPASRAIGYGKGAMVFHMARRLGGDEAFWKGLREVVRTKAFKEASWNDFASAFALFGQKDFTAFFQQWINRPGAPMLSLEDVRMEKTGETWKTRGYLTQEKPYYQLRVPLRLETEDGSVESFVELKDAKTSFGLESSSMPRNLTVDPEVDVFRRLHPDEIPPDVNTIKGSNTLTAVMAEGFTGVFGDGAKMFLESLGREDVTIIAEAEMKPARMKGRDILLFGLPSEKDLLPHVPHGLMLARDHFVVDGTKYAAPGDAAFLVLRSKLDPNKATAILLPFSTDAAALAARKVTHYGTYGALVISEGSVRVKKVWPVMSSPLIHDFSGKE